ncbi:class I SAM-dependent methyltransferase [Croceimicrobium sp.]|uniref:class I SAM-dependent methyltransferase n=1 Tax=Croceimicrobium sp. TaxID=2828340 RepID=UPI003BAAB54F
MSYYDDVGNYYDKDARDFENRYWKNRALQRIRQAFREEVKRYPFKKGLEVGIGPGFDLIHFARIFKESQFFGIDIAQEMVNLTADKIPSLPHQNTKVAQGSVEDLKRLFPDEKYDMIYVFFGALNTVEDLPLAFKELEKLMAPGGRMVLTFVNKWYLAGMLIELLKLKPRWAFARLRKVWGGYSPTQFLASKCYSSRQIKAMAKQANLHCLKREGFSIAYPAWYYHGLHQKLPAAILQKLWKLDRNLSKGPLGEFGEYALYEFRKAD